MKVTISGYVVDCTPAEFQQLTSAQRTPRVVAPPRTTSVATPYGLLTESERTFWDELFAENGWQVLNRTTSVLRGDCRIHGSTLRYARRHECVQCVRERDDRVKARRAAAQ